MAETFQVQSGGQDLSSFTSTKSAVRLALGDAPPRLPWTASLLVVIVCELGLLTLVRNGWETSDDGAGVVPLIALVGIALAALRWRPNPHLPPARGVSARLAVLILTSAAALTTYLVMRGPSGAWVGPAITLALAGTYLAMWGFRALALLRSIMLFTLLTWRPIAEAAHEIVRSTLDQPSGLIYQRLATLPVFGVEDEPWRLFTASLHRGSVVAIATISFAIAASRMRMSLRSSADLVVTVALAIVTHHVIILSSPIDEYAPADVAQVATNPTLEIGISVVAVLALIAIRQRRTQAAQAADLMSEVQHSGPTSHSVVPASDRDPVIFETARSRPHPLIVMMLFAGTAPLVTLALDL
jgi:hypothetical protein